MTATEDRLVQLADEELDLGHSPDLDQTFADSGASSVDVVSFLRFVAHEFNLSVTNEDLAAVTTLRELANVADSHSD